MANRGRFLHLSWNGWGSGSTMIGEFYGSCAGHPVRRRSRFDKSAVMSKGQRSILDAINEVIDGR